MNGLVPPKSKYELLERMRAIEGLSFAQLALTLRIQIPNNVNHRKGWIGLAIELALGADACSKSQPDFTGLGIELKTLPLSSPGKPKESTFITSIPLLSIHQQTWETSQCYAKLKHVLWVPVEGSSEIPYPQKRIGKAFLWSPSSEQGRVLAEDWNYLTTQITTGNIEMLDARAGEYLQIRPKAANGKALTDAFDAEGNKVKTLPRGFYLRARFTQQIMRSVDLDPRTDSSAKCKF